MKTVLVPVDGSHRALAAVRAAAREGSAAIARIELVNVQPLFHRHIARWVSRASRDGWRAERARRALEPALRVAEASGIAVGAHAMAGPTAPSILEVARRTGADEIVVASGRHTALGRLLAHSVSARLLVLSAIPVRVIPVGRASLLERVALPAGLGLAALLFLADE